MVESLNLEKKEENETASAAECLAWTERERDKLLNEARENGWQRHLENLSRLTKN